MPVSTPSDPQAAALLAHVLSQTQQNISFLAAQNYISPADATELIARLTQGPRATTPNVSTDSLASSMNNLAVGPVRSPSPARRVVPPPPPRTSTKRARALWPYNEDGREANDLSFSAGETVEIIEETNADWWTGKCRGKQGLFPANYVELLDAGRSPASPPPPVQMPGMPMPASSYYQAPPPPTYGMPNEPEKAAMYHQSYGPPAPAPPVQPSGPVQVVVQQQQEPQQPPKKNKFGKLGSTMATSAAGGVGFGAGAAIGSGIINSIF